MQKLEELREVSREIARLEALKRQLAEPLSSNIGLIHNLFDVFTLIVKKKYPRESPTTTSNRKKFLFAILYIFSPAALVGNSIKYRLREQISGLFGCSPTGVSRDYKASVFYYTTYREFREDVDMVINEMVLYINRR